MESNCAKRSGPFVALLFRNPARSPGLLYQEPRTELFPPFSAYPGRGPCPLRHLAARSSARSTRPPRGPHRAWRFRPRRSGPNPLGDVLGGVAGVEVDPREHDHVQVGQVGGRHCPIAIFLSRRAPSMAMPRPHARPFRSGRTAAFAESSWRGVAPNGRLGSGSLVASPGATERSGSARTCLSPVRSHALPSLLAPFSPEDARATGVIPC